MNNAASAYIADVTPPEKRAAAFGMLGSAFGLGFVLGPAICGIVGNVNPLPAHCMARDLPSRRRRTSNSAAATTGLR